MGYGTFGMKCLFLTEDSVGSAAGKVGKLGALISDTSVFFIIVSFYGLVVLSVYDLKQCCL
jgi:hypothetical protein